MKKEVELNHWDALNEIWRKLDKLSSVDDEVQEQFDIVSNYLEVLDIINKKSVNVYILKHSSTLATYNDMVDSEDRKLTLEEYRKLIEVFLNV